MLKSSEHIRFMQACVHVVEKIMKKSESEWDWVLWEKKNNK